jgi:indolepyruvate ferredoxin oxidoreductase alpha subunit
MPVWSGLNKLETPKFDYMKVANTPSTYAQERLKMDQRMPAAIKFIKDNNLNEFFPGDIAEVGILVQGGLYNTLIRALQHYGLADNDGNSRIPIYCMNVTYPLVDEELVRFCVGKQHVLMVEEGHPDYIEQALNTALRRNDVQTKIHGKGPLPMGGQYNADVLQNGIAKWLGQVKPSGVDLDRIKARPDVIGSIKGKAIGYLGGNVPARPPSFCTGCPERPLFSAMKILRTQEPAIGDTHVAADIGCTTFSTQAPFNVGNSVLGYGMGLASAGAVAPTFGKRVISVMGDGGFWHNGLTNGVASAVYNKQDSLLVIVDNKYTSATGQHHNPSTGTNARHEPTGMTIPQALRGVGVK